MRCEVVKIILNNDVMPDAPVANRDKDEYTAGGGESIAIARERRWKERISWLELNFN